MDQECDGPNPIAKEEAKILTGMEEEVDGANDMVEQEESTGSAPGPSFSGRNRNPKRFRSKVWEDFTPIFAGTKLERAECMHCQKVYIVGSSGTSSLLKHQAKCSIRAQKRPMQDKLPILPSTQKSTIVPGSDSTQRKLPFPFINQKKCLSTADAMLEKKGLALLDIPNDMNQEVDQNSSHEELAARVQKNQSPEELAVPDQAIPTNINPKNLEVAEGEPHEVLVRIFAAHGHSPWIRDNNRFSRFVACLNPMVKMPAELDMCRYFKGLFDKEKTKLKEKLSALRSRVCLSAYVWHYDMLSAFLCLSVHYIDDEWEKQKNIIKFRAVDPSCSAEELSQSILYAIDDWGLCDKVFSIILDDAFLDDSVVSDVKARLQKWNLRSANQSLYTSANQSMCTSANQSLFVIRYPTHLVKQVIQVGKDELEKVMQKSTKYSEYAKGHIPSVVHYPGHRYAPSREGWTKAKKICKVMENLQRLMDDEIHNCCNPADLFDKVWDVKKLLHRDADSYSWRGSKISKELEKMQNKFEEQWKLCCLNICMPMIMDPSCRLKRIKSCLRSDAGHYQLGKRDIEDDMEDYIEEVHAILLNLFYEYSDQVEDTSCTSGSKTRDRTVMEGRDTLMDYYHDDRYPYSERPMTELDQYMQEPGLSADESSVLQWWKEHNLTYPTIARMARDILAVPLGVDCNAAIKTGRRTICDSSSLWREEVVCIQEWLRSDGSFSE